VNRSLRRLSVLTLATTLLLVAVGGLVRASGSGLGCPGWPRCYGLWFPPFGQHGEALHHALIEYSHRFLTTITVILIILLVVVAWWRKGDRRAPTAWAATVALVLILVQAGLGAAVVKSELNPVLVTLHYANAMLLVATLVLAVVTAYVDLRTYRATGRHRRFANVAAGVTAASFVVILLGTYVRGENAGLAFPDWPLMNGKAIPNLSLPLAAPQFAHRLAVLVVFVGIVVLARMAWTGERDRPPVRVLALTSAGLFVVQALLGATLIWTSLATGARVGHEAVGALVWAALVATTVLAYRFEPTGEARAAEARRQLRSAVPIAGGSGVAAALPVDLPAERGEPALATRIGAYVDLMKPHIIILLLITTVPPMVLAQGGWPSPWLILATLFGGTLAAGGANVINCYIDRDIDQVMHRTSRRPLPAHSVSPQGALVFGIALSITSFVFLWVTTNLLAASLAVSAILFYVFVYTLWLKRTTPQNIVIGGAAGAVPCLVGWAAVTGTVGLPAVVLFLIVFYWTPPHFWALSMRYEAEYRSAGVPMLPVVRGVPETTRQIVLYTLILLALTLLLYPVGGMGPVYLIAAVGLGAVFLFEALRLRREPTVPRAMHLFHYSNTYLALLFAAVAIDPLLRAAL
jgi:protoheme IX farnesyltransferase